MPDYHAELYYLQENEETFSTAIVTARQAIAFDALPHEHIRYAMRAEGGEDEWTVALREFGLAVEADQAACSILDAIMRSGGGGVHLQEEQALCEYIYRTHVTCLHTYRFLLLKERFERGEKAVLSAMLQIAAAERDNAMQAERLYAELPWLDLSLRLEAQFPSSMKMLHRKIALLEALLEQGAQHAQ